MKYVAIAATACGALILGGCSMTLPLQGRMQNSEEVFNGTATGYMDGGGDLTAVTSKGATCKGNFVYVTSREGRGIFTCDDNRSGPFEFVSTGKRGTGTGTLNNGDRMIFTFGN